MSDLLAAALDYARRGWAVFPCTPGGKRPLGRLAPEGLHSATTSEVVIRAWWAAEPNANVGVATGEKSGLLVVDVDAEGMDAFHVVGEDQRRELAARIKGLANGLTGGGEAVEWE